MSETRIHCTEYTVAISMQMDHVEFLSGTCFGVNQSFWHVSAIRGEGEAQRVGPMWLKIYTSDMERRWLFLIPLIWTTYQDLSFFYLNMFCSFQLGLGFSFLPLLPGTWQSWHLPTTIGSGSIGTTGALAGSLTESLKMKGICMACWFRRCAGGLLNRQEMLVFVPNVFWNSPAKRWRCWRCLVFFHKSKAQIWWYQ